MTFQSEFGIGLQGYGSPTLSPDGYVRLTLEQFRTVVLRHLWSGLDPEDSASLYTGAIETHITGYTEWISETTPALSIGWDWQLQGVSGHVHYLRGGTCRTNIMLVDAFYKDYGTVETSRMLQAVIDETDWQMAVRQQLMEGDVCQAVKCDS